MFLTPAKGRLSALLFAFIALVLHVNAQTNCAFNSVLAQGYTVSIRSVVENPNGSHTIVLQVLNNGCSGCKKLNNFTVQAAAGTYSNVSVQLVSGAFTYANLSLGPNLSGTSYTGFRINNTNGMGNGQAAAFTITYTLSGPLQDQRTDIKAGTQNMVLTSYFTAANFQAVKDCLAPPANVIFPYFNPSTNKSYDIIGVELTSLYNIHQSTGTYISDDIFQILGSSVRIAIRTRPGQHAAAVSLLATPTYGLVQELDDPVNNLVNGTYPINKLLLLNQLPDLLVSARPIYAALSNAGLITSQGDTALRSFRAREVFGVDGTGIKVGVISDSYNTKLGDPAADDVLRGDLPGLTNAAHPAPVQVLQEYPYGTRTDEGRAMLQIVHDVAPGAELAFHTGFTGALDMAKGIRDLQLAGCDVIVDDVSYISEPCFRDGVIAQAVDAVKALGVSYFSAAGNFGTRSLQSTFAPVAAPAGLVGQAHNFRSGYGTGTDILQGITLYEGEYTMVLQWDDGTPGTTTSSDFDIYLANTNGNTLFGFNRMNVGGDPLEVLPFVVTADSVQSNIVIVRESGTAAATLKYIVYRGALSINEYGGLTSGTITGQANAAGAIAVGAVLYTNTPEYGGVPGAASFSSRGGTRVNGVDRNKPDLCAPNGVNTSVDLGGVNYDGDAFPNFFGTSAAAPHAAGVAALVQHGRNKYYGNTLSPDLLKGLLQNTATDMGAPGYDAASGAGLLLADSALMGLANPTPYITSIAYDTTLTPGVDTLLLTVYGEYLSDQSTVWLDGAPLTSGVVIQGDTAIITLVQPFTGLYPEIQVYNPPMAGTNGTDGGLSNPLYFTTKETVLVRVGDATKKYGEALPAFTAQYTVESVSGSTPLASAGLTPAEVQRIQSIGLTTIATSLSNVGLWAIGADANDPLNPNSTVAATAALDRSLLERYDFVFDDGLLTIDPVGLHITPRDTSVVYNVPLTYLGLNYALSNGATITTTDRTTITTGVRSAHGTALVNGQVGLVRGTALVNGAGEQLLTEAVLNNYSATTSQRISTTRGTALVNGELIDPAELYQATAFANAVSRLVRGTALVNGYPLVRGTALVNTIDEQGNVTSTSALVNANSLVNTTGGVNSTTITLNSNTQTLAILGDEDIAILTGAATGQVEMRSVNLVTGNTVGTHLIVPGTFLSNNFNVTYGLGHITVTPAPAQFTIATNTLSTVYDGAPKAVGVTVVPAGVPYTVTYNGSTTPPVNAGTYAVAVTVNDPNYMGTASATLVVQKANPQLALGALTQTYSGTARTVTATTVPAGLATTITYNGSTTAPVNAGTYAVVATVNTANHAGTASGTLVVQKAPATATTGVYVINKGAPLPAFTATYSGFLNGQTASVVTSVSFTFSPNYTGQAGVYQIIVNATAANYTFTSVNGTLYVNPSGPGTKQVKPSFICYQVQNPPVNGYTHVAWFNYDNPNPTAVYLPVGPANSFSGSARDASLQPTLFQPGLSAPIAIPYMGGALTWQITSNKNNGTTGSIPANNSNVVCTSPGVKSRAVDEEPVSVPADVRIYPNPSTGKVFVEFAENGGAGARVEVFNALGARCPVQVEPGSGEHLVLDLSAQGTGLFIIRITRESGTETRQVIIE
ncbi:MAG: S8 family serine peptidase [Flavobacteriales bacterium]|nr:S8 family serine peptidase [Flavobacteriales bacterium]